MLWAHPPFIFVTTVCPLKGGPWGQEAVLWVKLDAVWLMPKSFTWSITWYHFHRLSVGKLLPLGMWERGRMTPEVTTEGQALDWPYGRQACKEPLIITTCMHLVWSPPLGWAENPWIWRAVTLVIRLHYMGDMSKAKIFYKSVFLSSAAGSASPHQLRP